MPSFDKFESVFRAASKSPLVYERVPIGRILLATDLAPLEAEALGATTRGFLGALEQTDGSGDVEWIVLSRDDFATVADLLDRVIRHTPDLICTYRHLMSDAWKWPYSLGEHIDVLTQVAPSPVLLLPHPLAERAAEHALRDTDHVMAMTDHLAGDHRLVNYAVRFTPSGGTVYLAHIEDRMVLDRYLDVIGKIPEIDTEVARDKLEARLLKDATDYIESCRTALAKAGVSIRTEPVVTTGHHLAEYKRLIEEHEIDLLVMNTRDDDQMAMHGIAYSLAVELRSIPLLML